jgi:hypothetical protein
MAKRGHQVGGQGRSQKPSAKQNCLRSGSPGTPGLGGANKMLDATLRGSRQQGVDIGKPFEPVPPV